LQQTALLASQQTLVTVSVEQMSSATVLVRALGGGWSRADLPTPDQVTEPAPAAAREIRP
jgi:outer membrane protein TolC